MVYFKVYQNTFKNQKEETMWMQLCLFEKLSTMKLIFYIISVFVLFLFSCGDKKMNEVQILVRATNNIAKFYAEKDTTNLYRAMLGLDSISDNYLQKKSVQHRIQVYHLLGEYSKVLTYIGTLEESKFNRKYQKQMYLLYYSFLQEEQINDTILYNQCINQIQNEITQTSDIEVYSDYIILANLLVPENRLVSKIDEWEFSDKISKEESFYLKQLITR